MQKHAWIMVRGFGGRGRFPSNSARAENEEKWISLVCVAIQLFTRDGEVTFEKELSYSYL